MSIIKNSWITPDRTGGDHNSLSIQSMSADPLVYGYIHFKDQILGEPKRQVIVLPLLSEGDLLNIYKTIGVFFENRLDQSLEDL